jgi:hypothetical protein
LPADNSSLSIAQLMSALPAKQQQAHGAAVSDAIANASGAALSSAAHAPASMSEKGSSAPANLAAHHNASSISSTSASAAAAAAAVERRVFGRRLPPSPRNAAAGGSSSDNGAPDGDDGVIDADGAPIFARAIPILSRFFVHSVHVACILFCCCALKSCAGMDGGDLARMQIVSTVEGSRRR